jgi:multiple sugar transport system ATP-binding protein
MAGVKINRLSKRFGDLTVLKNISMLIENGEFLTLLGPSGCGKTTLLRLIAGLEDISDGHIHIDENCVNDVRPKDRNIAMVFQSYALYPHLTVFGNIAMPLMMRRLKPYERWPIVGKLSHQSRQTHKEIRESVRQVAKMLDIEHLLDRKPSQISGGQRQRVALGRAMVRNPSVFLMDEPLSNLDAKLRVHMRTEIAGLHRKLRSTFVYVTHDHEEAMTMSDRIALMIDGQLLQIAPPKRSTVTRTI